MKLPAKTETAKSQHRVESSDKEQPNTDDKGGSAAAPGSPAHDAMAKMGARLTSGRGGSHLSDRSQEGYLMVDALASVSTLLVRTGSGKRQS